MPVRRSLGKLPVSCFYCHFNQPYSLLLSEINLIGRRGVTKPRRRSNHRAAAARARGAEENTSVVNPTVAGQKDTQAVPCPVITIVDPIKGMQTQTRILTEAPSAMQSASILLTPGDAAQGTQVSSIQIDLGSQTKVNVISAETTIDPVPSVVNTGVQAAIANIPRFANSQSIIGDLNANAMESTQEMSSDAMLATILGHPLLGAHPKGGASLLGNEMLGVQLGGPLSRSSCIDLTQSPLLPDTQGKWNKRKHRELVRRMIQWVLDRDFEVATFVWKELPPEEQTRQYEAAVCKFIRTNKNERLSRSHDLRLQGVKTITLDQDTKLLRPRYEKECGGISLSQYKRQTQTFRAHCDSPKPLEEGIRITNKEIILIPDVMVDPGADAGL
eukprot:augustus_masked-scaffold_8-processed-gene-10.0-mRNA-1 protein AED:1.00 eAED:1.00 QI:0/0/0/0/1/1/6/0/386